MAVPDGRSTRRAGRTNLDAPPLTGLPETPDVPAAVREALAVLAWYADEKNWERPSVRVSSLSKAAFEEGARARAALARLDETRKGVA